MDLKCIARGQRIAVTFQGSSRHFTIQAVEYDAERANANIGLVSPATEIHLAEPIAATDQSPSASDTNYVKKLSSGYDAIGGLSSQIRDIRELVELPLTRPDLYRHFAMTPPCGLLLWGPPGTGKTLLAHTIAASLAVPAFSVAGASLSSPYHGETEAQLRTVFQKARASAPSVVVLDEVDALAPRREDAGEVEKRVVAELLTLMDGLDGKNTSEDDDECSAPKQVMVIACTNRPNAIDPALRRPGRFDKEIEIGMPSYESFAFFFLYLTFRLSGIPNVEARLNILEVLLRNTPHDLTADIVASFANRSHGFVGADLAALVDASCLCAIRRTVSSSVSPDQMRLTEADMESSFLTTRPSAMREVFLEVPKVKWEDIGGQTSAKQRLKESVEWPLTRKATIERLGFKPPAGVLLYGPPGCSKTLIAKAVATEAGLNFMAVKGPEVCQSACAFSLAQLVVRSSTSLSVNQRGPFELYSKRQERLHHLCSFL